MKLRHYHLVAETVPAEHDILAVWQLIDRCAAEWSRKVGEDVLQFGRVDRLAKADLVIGFGENPRWPAKIAFCESRPGLGHNLVFDRRARWEISRLQRWFGRVGGESFIALCLHEIGHALGCVHSPDPASIMHHAPTRTTVNANVAAFVRAKILTEEGLRA